MAGVIAGSMTRYIPKELPEHDRKMLGLEKKVAGVQPSGKDEIYGIPKENYPSKY